MKLVFFAGAEVDGTLYFSSWNSKEMFKVERNAGNVSRIGSISEEEQTWGLHTHAFTYKNKIYFIPGYGETIAVVDVNDLTIKTITLPKRTHVCKNNKFANVLQVHNDLWLIPMGYDALVRLDLLTEEIEVYDNWPEDVLWEHEIFKAFQMGVYVADHICMLPRECNFFVTFNTKTKKMQKWDYKYPKFTFDAMIQKDDYIWFLPRADYPYIEKYSVEKKETECISLKEDVQDEILCLYSEPLVIGNKIVRAPYQTDAWFILDMDTGKVTKRTCIGTSEDKRGKYPLFQKLTVFDGGIVATNGVDGIAQKMSMNLSEVSEFPLVTDKILSQYMKFEKDMIMEMPGADLNSYINALVIMGEEE